MDIRLLWLSMRRKPFFVSSGLHTVVKWSKNSLNVSEFDHLLDWEVHVCLLVNGSTGELWNTLLRISVQRDWMSKSSDTGNESDDHTSVTRCHTAHLFIPFCSNNSAIDIPVSSTFCVYSGSTLWYSRTLMHFWTNNSTTDDSCSPSKISCLRFSQGDNLWFIKSENHCSLACQVMSHVLGTILWLFLRKFIC